MKLGTLINGRRVFMPTVNEKISTRLAYKIFKFIKRVESVDLPFYEEKVKAIVEKYAEKDADGKFTADKNGKVRITEDKHADYIAEMTELDNIDTDYDGALFTVDELSEIKLSVMDIILLGELVTEG